MTEKLKYVVGADTGAAKAALEKLDDALAKVGEGFRKAGGSADGMGDAVKTAAEKASATAKQVEAAFRTLHVRSTATATKQKESLVKAYDTIRISGTASASDIRRAHDVLQAKLKKIDDELKTGTLRYRLFGKEAQAAYGKIASAAGSALRAVRNISLGLAGTATATGIAIYKTAKSTADYADEIGKMSERSGVAPEALSALRMAAEQGDVSFEQLGSGLKKFNLTLAKAGMKEEEVFARLRADLAAAGGDEEKIAAAKEKADEALNDPFRALGVKTKDAKGKVRATLDLLKDVADKVKAIPDPAQKLEMSTRFFGKEGGEQFLTLLNLGSEGIRRYEDEVRRLGIEVSAGLAAQGQQFNDTLDTLGKAWEGLKLSIGQQVLGQFATLFTSLTGMVVENRDSIAKALGDISAKFVEIVQDIVRLLKGEDSDVQNKWLITLRDNIVNLLPTMEEFKTTIRTLYLDASDLFSAFKNLYDVLKPLLDLVGSVSKGLFNTGKQLGSDIVETIWWPIQKLVDLSNQIRTGTTDGTGWGSGSMTDRLALDASGPGYARGGVVRGPGSGTSDSILARLSNGEFVMSASAVRKYGAGMLARMNAMALPSYRLPTPRMGRAMPAFAAGGLVGGGATRLELSLGGQVFNMQASTSTVRELTKHVRNAERRRITTTQAPWVKS